MAQKKDWKSVTSRYSWQREEGLSCLSLSLSLYMHMCVIGVFYNRNVLLYSLYNLPKLFLTKKI